MSLAFHPLQTLLLTLAGLLNRRQQQIVESLVEENRVLRGHMEAVGELHACRVLGGPHDRYSRAA